MHPDGGRPGRASVASQLQRPVLAVATIDRAGATISLVCMLHCLLPMLAIVSLPAFFAAPLATHSLLFVTALGACIGSLAFCSARAPVRLSFLLGLSLLLLGLGAEYTPLDILHIPLTAMGALTLIWAHWRNLQTQR